MYVHVKVDMTLKSCSACMILCESLHFKETFKHYTTQPFTARAIHSLYMYSTCVPLM